MFRRPGENDFLHRWGRGDSVVWCEGKQEPEEEKGEEENREEEKWEE